MSISSICSLTSVYSLNNESKSFALKEPFQKAFDELNVELIIKLLDQGASPNQNIVVNQTLLIALYKEAINTYYDREDSIETIVNLVKVFENPEAVELIGFYSKEILEKARLIKNDLEQEIPVSDEAIKELEYELVIDITNECDCNLEQPLEKYISTPLQIAVELRLETLIQKLIDAGAEPIDCIN